MKEFVSETQKNEIVLYSGYMKALKKQHNHIYLRTTVIDLQLYLWRDTVHALFVIIISSQNSDGLSLICNCWPKVDDSGLEGLKQINKLVQTLSLAQIFGTFDLEQV